MKKQITPKPEDYAMLQTEVAHLRKALKDSNLDADFYDTMIDVAEEMFKIPLRKKLVPSSKFVRFILFVEWSTLCY